MGTLMNRAVVLRRRPVGAVRLDDFEVVDAPVPQLGPGEALLQVESVSIDPTIRGWLDEGGNYMAPVALGEPVRSNGVGRVIATNDPDTYPLGRRFMALTGWQTYRVVSAREMYPLTPIPEGTRPNDALHVLGHIGMTAFLGVTEVARPQPGETFVVSAAASSVGSLAGQIAHMRGARVVGIAGTPEKCAYVIDELGFDGCIDYKLDDVAARLKALCPNGIDVYFDNVGGPLLDTVMRRLAVRGRVVLCGDIASYDTNAPEMPRSAWKYVMGKRAILQGFNTLDHWDRYEEAAAQLRAWLDDGSIRHREHVLEGIERAPEGLIRLFAGDHLGKLVVQVEPA
jgi:NADPH-dependent curcumin reductase CurA